MALKRSGDLLPPRDDKGYKLEKVMEEVSIAMKRRGEDLLPEDNVEMMRYRLGRLIDEVSCLDQALYTQKLDFGHRQQQHTGRIQQLENANVAFERGLTNRIQKDAMRHMNVCFRQMTEEEVNMEDWIEQMDEVAGRFDALRTYVHDTVPKLKDATTRIQDLETGMEAILDAHKTLVRENREPTPQPGHFGIGEQVHQEI